MPNKKMKKVKKHTFRFSNQTIDVDKSVSKRIIAFAVLIGAVFLIVFCRLVYLQVFSYDDYVEKKDDYTSILQYTSAPRGQIYDCKGRVLAKTVVSHNIVFTSPNNMTTEDYLIYANRIASVFDINLDDFSLQTKKEAYIAWKNLLDPDDKEYAGNNFLTEKERVAYVNGVWGSNAESKKYSILMSRISEDDLKEMNDEELKTYIIYSRMIANLSTGQESVILEDVSDEDVAYLVEHKTEFPGFDVDFGGWKREYPYGETLSDVLGRVSTSTEGLPAESKDHYLSKGYQLNAPVGVSGLEYQYNDILAGTEEISKITYDSNGLAIKEIVQSARKGNDIVISIDIDLQQTMDDTVKNVLQANAGTRNRENFKSLFMCMMDPNNGSLLALSGYQIDLETKQMTYFASGNYVSLANPGSCIKGATVYMGLSEGVVSPGETIMDETMNINGEEFGSFEDHGPVNDVSALEVSSNVYMFHIAIRLGGDTYKEGQPLNIADVQGTFNTMRRYYSMFGLGNKTGLDIPGEIPGYMGVVTSPGLLLNYSIGQLDMYTPVQLLQYASVIATDGKMYAPHFLEYAKEVGGDEIFDVYGKHLESELPTQNDQYLKRVQEGFRACVTSGNCGNALQDMEEPMAAKTGTAEVESVWTTANLVGFGPYDDPQVAFACVSPTSSVNNESVSDNICGSAVVGPVLDKYFELYPE
ncbi:hypothetical protein C815_01031 [Firmicutes bacterium M10-2]|nr:hypothetical protein C815_01031 [Firmicutes bacterium M10-2]